MRRSWAAWAPSWPLVRLRPPPPPPFTLLTHHACLCGAARMLAWICVWATKTNLLWAILMAMSSALFLMTRSTDLHSTGYWNGCGSYLVQGSGAESAALRAQGCWTRAGAM